MVYPSAWLAIGLAAHSSRTGVHRRAEAIPRLPLFRRPMALTATAKDFLAFAGRGEASAPVHLLVDGAEVGESLLDAIAHVRVVERAAFDAELAELFQVPIAHPVIDIPGHVVA